MTKDNKNNKNTERNLYVDQINDTDIELWAEYFGTDKPVDDKEHEIIIDMADKVANLGDITALVRYLDDASRAEIMQTMSIFVRRLSIMEYVINDKLKVDQKELEEYSKKYDKELAEVKAEMEKLQKQQEETEDKNE